MLGIPQTLLSTVFIFVTAGSSLYADGDLANPSFSEPSVSSVQIVATPRSLAHFGSYPMIVYPSSIPGWTLVKGSIDVVNLASQPGYGGSFQDNPQAIDLNGYVGVTPKGCAATVYQDVSMTPGRSYTYTFGLAANTAGEPRVKTVRILWGIPGAKMTLVGRYSVSSAAFQEHHFTVHARGPRSRLELISTTDTMSSYGAYICFSSQEQETKHPSPPTPPASPSKPANPNDDFD